MLLRDSLAMTDGPYDFGRGQSSTARLSNKLLVSPDTTNQTNNVLDLVHNVSPKIGISIPTRSEKNNKVMTKSEEAEWNRKRLELEREIMKRQEQGSKQIITPEERKEGIEKAKKGEDTRVIHNLEDEIAKRRKMIMAKQGRLKLQAEKKLSPVETLTDGIEPSFWLIGGAIAVYIVGLLL